MDDFKYRPAQMPEAQAFDDGPGPGSDDGQPPHPEEPPTVPGVHPAVAKFQSCRWRATPEQGEFCTHRDVLPFAGKEGFKPESWCPECAFYKLRRTPKKRERIDYSY